MSIGHYLVLSGLLFAIGTAGVFLRRNLITLLLSVEIMLNAVNLAFVAFGRQLGEVDGQIITFFVMAVAAAEASIPEIAKALVGRGVPLHGLRARRSSLEEQFLQVMGEDERPG